MDKNERKQLTFIVILAILLLILFGASAIKRQSDQVSLLKQSVASSIIDIESLELRIETLENKKVIIASITIDSRMISQLRQDVDELLLWRLDDRVVKINRKLITPGKKP